jgi:hypothetical protein
VRQQRGTTGIAGELVYRGVRLGAEQWGWVEQRVDENPRLTRLELAREVCKHFGWRRADGLPAVDATRLLLARSERRGLVRLPAARRRAVSGAMARGAQLPTDVPLGPTPGAEPPCVSGALLVRPIAREERLGWRVHMQRHHYLGDCAHVGESIRYAAFVDGQLVALLSWATAALHNPPRDRYVGWDAACKARGLHRVVNNARFLMLPWARVLHLASRIVAANLRRLSRDWEAAYGHGVWLAETFVDVSRFRGTCYRASNWIELEQTRGFSRRAGGRYEPNGQPKAVFVYPLVRNVREKLCAAESVAGNHQTEAGNMEATKVFDVSKLPLQGEGSLFELFAGMADFRKARGKRHSIQFILAVGACAVLAGRRALSAIAEWAADQPRETLKKLGSRYGKPPSEPTVRRVLGRMDIAELDRRVGEWMRKHLSLRDEGLALDGKTARGSADADKPGAHLVSVVSHRDGVVIAQHQVPDKTNEIKSVEPVLGPLDIEGATVTGDAMFTQKEIAKYIVEQKRADYHFTVKDNQPTLRADIESLHLEAFPPGSHDD